MLRGYLPENVMAAVAPTAVRGASLHDYQQEREILFNMIFRLQSEIDTLRQAINHRSAAVNEHPVSHSLVRVTDLPGDVYAAPSQPIDTLHTEVFDSTPASGDNPGMTLEDTERETIRRSLEKNGGIIT